MKKYIYFLFVLAILFTGCSIDSKKSLNSNSIESIYIEKDFECNKEVKLYHTDSNGINYYTVCLNEITLKYSDREISLKNILDSNVNIMYEITNKLTQTAVLYDGGTSIYKDFGYSEVVFDDLGNTGFTVIKCHTLEGNNDYYLGDLSLEYMEDFCK